MTRSTSAYLFQPIPHPYIIYTTDYAEHSNRIRSLHLLCHALNRAGCEAYVMTGMTNPLLRTPPIQLLRRSQLSASGRRPIIVYPETVSGNPLEEAVVARWLLGVPGALMDQWQRAYGVLDLLFYSDETFLIDGLAGTALSMPACDLTVYNNFGNPDHDRRRGYLFYDGRYCDTGLPAAEFLREATLLSPDIPRTPQQLADLYRRSEALFTYEPTDTATEAILCGCPVVYLESPILPRRPVAGPIGDGGTAWGFGAEQLARARATIDEFWHCYQRVLADFDDQLRRFIEITQERADHLTALSRRER